jgi:predicted AlkP superfamily phosphohydrolase/phosphomutase
MILIGIDGLSWDSVNYFADYLPCLTHLQNPFNAEWSTATLHTHGIPHTAPSWTTIFTGKSWEDHKIENFTKPFSKEYYTRNDLKHPYIWEVLQAQGKKCAAFSTYSFLPPVHFGVEVGYNLKFDLTLTHREMKEELNIKSAYFDFLNQDLEYDLIVGTVIMLDKAHHISHKNTGHNLDGALYAYKMIDQWLNLLLSKLRGRDIVLISDHGQPGKAFRHPDGYKIPGHRPDGIIAANFKTTLPETTIDVFNWLLDCTNSGRIEVAPTNSKTGYTKEEEKLINERLGDLGYLEG